MIRMFPLPCFLIVCLDGMRQFSSDKKHGGFVPGFLSFATSFSLTPKAISSYITPSKRTSFQSIQSIGPIVYPEAREILLKLPAPSSYFFVS